MDFINSIIELDRSLTLAINGAHTPFTDQVWMFFSAVKPWYILYVAVAAAIVWRLGWKKGITFILAAVLCVVCTDQFANLIKNSVCRPRPCCDVDMLIAGLNAIYPQKTISFGFFSGHAANTMGFAVLTSIAFFQDRQKSSYRKIYFWCILLWALLVGASRIFCGMHFLGDVLAGFAEGAIFGGLLGMIAAFICRRFIKD